MKRYTHIYFIGIGGIGMAAIARWLKQQKKEVFGYDKTATLLTEQLIMEGIPVNFEDELVAIPTQIIANKADTLVIYTPAIPQDHYILNYLQEQGYTIQSRAPVLGGITKNKFTIAVGGTHGKTTITAMIAHILYYTNKNMIAFVGGIVQGHNSNCLMNCKIEAAKIIVTEADEFNRSFLELSPNYSIISAIDADHPETYTSKNDMVKAFQQFIRNTSEKLIIQEKASQQLIIDPAYSGTVLTYGSGGGAAYAANVHLDPIHTHFDYVSPAMTLKKVVLPMPGAYNIENAIAAITACLYLGVDEESIRQGLHTFQGIQRRFSYIVRHENCVFIDDYAHHPTEVRALLETVRALYPDKCITAIFQPHLYSRTAAFASEFGASLSLADQVFLLPIYPAREAPIPGVDSTLILNSVTTQDKWMTTSSLLVDDLEMHSQSEVTITIGAGDISQLVQPVKGYLLSKTW